MTNIGPKSAVSQVLLTIRIVGRRIANAVRASDLLQAFLIGAVLLVVSYGALFVLLAVLP
jgi:hypothetical protein